jgi:Na+:H+ antiporter, NhaA family
LARLQPGGVTGLTQVAVPKPRSALRRFLASEAAGGLLLMAAAAAALLMANSALSWVYFAVRDTHIGPMSVLHWINDALMALFFLLVGLEIKREFIDGHLVSWADRRLPVIAAAAGMVVPALIYLVLTRNDAHLLRGWAIPAATDIAFAIGVLSLLGRRVPTSLKLFLTTVAIVDDMGAVLIIAIGYTAAISGPALLAALIILAVMFGMNRAGVKSVTPFLVAFIFLWVAVFLSGVHATIAGVLTAMMIPLRVTKAAPDAEDSTLHRIENMLQRPVAWLIVPLFGFANAGVALGGVALLAPLPLGIAAGLFLGKQIGIYGSVWLTVKLGWTARPAQASWTQIYGVALLCGIGFTMSLFIGGLAFSAGAQSDAVKIGVLMGSGLSALAGWAVLRAGGQTRKDPRSGGMERGST